MDYCCFVCNNSITSAEYKYSVNKFGRALCRQHQKDSSTIDHTNSSSNESEKDDQNGNVDRTNSVLNWKQGWRNPENMIKGRIAETLIEELFLQLGFSVFRYGMENTIPGVMQLLKGVRSDVATNIRRMPDFVVQNPNTHEVSFVEVKFRKSESFKLKDAGEDYPYENCFFIVVSKKHIKCITYQELKEGKEITPKSINYLGNRKEFELDKDTIIQYCDFAVKFFESV